MANEERDFTTLNAHEVDGLDLAHSEFETNDKE